MNSIILFPASPFLLINNSKLSSPFLVKLYGTSLRPLGMIMEFCPHKSLDHHFMNKKYDWDWNLRIKVAYDIIRGLAVLHSQSPPIIHRDLRSPNIFVCSVDHINLTLFSCITLFSIFTI
jgi:serine/threonine protein kinase